MNSAPENITVLPANHDQPLTSAASGQIQNPTPHNQKAPHPRRNGKIAHLPKEQRDTINHMLDDGATYETISAKFAEQGISLNLVNIHGWFHGGYQDYLQACDRRQQIRDTQDRLLDLARNSDAPALSFVGLQLAVTQLAQQLYEISPESHKQSFQT